MPCLWIYLAIHLILILILIQDGRQSVDSEESDHSPHDGETLIHCDCTVYLQALNTWLIFQYCYYSYYYYYDYYYLWGKVCICIVFAAGLESAGVSTHMYSSSIHSFIVLSLDSGSHCP